MKYHLEFGLPFVNVSIQFRGRKLILRKILLDTGSAGTIFNANVVGDIGVIPESDDIVDTIRGVGGVEYVYTKNFEAINLDGICLNNYQVEVGNMDYGIEIDGILGFDFIQTANLIINTNTMQVFAFDHVKE
jgi:hypothetical protein